MRLNFIKPILFSSGLMLIASMACSGSTNVATQPPPPPPTYTSYPTYPPNPTFTPYPTYTPYPINTPVPPTILAPTAGISNPTNTVIGALSSTPTTDPTQAAISNQQQLMDYIISNTTHFQGDPNAKVTIIEFSDFQ